MFKKKKDTEIKEKELDITEGIQTTFNEDPLNVIVEEGVIETSIEAEVEKNGN